MGKISVTNIETPVANNSKPLEVNSLPPVGFDLAVQTISDRVNPSKSDTDIDIDVLKLKKHLGIGYGDTESDNQIKKILEWGNKHDISKDDLISQIKVIEAKIGKSWGSKENVQKLYTYLTIHEQMNELAHKLSVLEL